MGILGVWNLFSLCTVHTVHTLYRDMAKASYDDIIMYTHTKQTSDKRVQDELASCMSEAMFTV